MPFTGSEIVFCPSVLCTHPPTLKTRVTLWPVKQSLNPMVSDPHVRVPLVLTAVDLEVVRWELVLGVDLVSSPAVWQAPLVQRTCQLLE